MNLNEQERIPLWPAHAIPGVPRDTPDEETWEKRDNIVKVLNVTRPELYRYLSPSAPAKAPVVIIAPGGGYNIIAMEHEGSQVAEAFNRRGVHAFVLKYRLPNEDMRKTDAFWPLEDLQRAIQLVRERSGEWGIDPAKVGTMGFSAGGNLVGMGSVFWDKPAIPAVEGISLRPDFNLPVYGVLSLKEQGRNEEGIPSPDELVNSQTPPAYLCHAEDDNVVPIGNSYAYKKAMEAHGVPVELDVLPRGGHGFGMIPCLSGGGFPPAGWFDRAVDWVDKITSP